MAKKFLVLSLLSLTTILQAQNYRWQQRVEYTMHVHLNVTNHLLTGDQKLVYHNNSPDTLKKVYYHLYFNAFQPESMMDVRSRTLPDPDKRIGDRISQLKKDEIGYQHIQGLKQDGKNTTWRVDGTILEVTLPTTLLPGQTTTFELTFEAQVPVQIRRCGRDNKEGIAYSMTQWYPKIAEYDFQGWHANQYVAREFFGVWGDFDVTITLDPTFVVAATGKLQNPERIGYGYERKDTEVKRPSGELSWHFVAKNVHDFAWAADPDYTHETVTVPDGPEVHFFYQKSAKTEPWTLLPKVAVGFFQFMNAHFGKYPFDSYSIIQGGDGGMEYAMCTLILGEGTFDGTAGTMIHEVAHSWFQMVLASNESQYAWMDEGFTRFAEFEVINALFEKGAKPNPHAETYNGYIQWALEGKEEPASQFADFFSLNKGYRFGAYFKGCLLLSQLRYIVGEDAFWKGMKRYFNTWKFRHPEPIDFLEVMEKTSGMQLKWYLNYWISTTKQINYGITDVSEQDGITQVTLQRKGELPMPVELLATYKDGTKELFYIPLNETLGSKPNDVQGLSRQVLTAWPWVNPLYIVTINRKKASIGSLEIDPGHWTADVNVKDNKVDLLSEGGNPPNH